MDVLVVDDEPLALELMVETLAGGGRTVHSASDGARALAHLEAGLRPDVVVLDRMMPGLDGLTLLTEIKRREGLGLLPVILQTAAVSDVEVAEGIRAGAYYYLTKPYAPAVLLALVEAAAAEHHRRRHLQARVASAERGCKLVERLEVGLRSPEDVDTTSELLARCFPEPSRVVTGLSELLMNAVEHGNLELGYQEKSRLLASGQWQSELQRRLGEPRLGQRRVQARLWREAGEVAVEVQDEGSGFDWRGYLDIDPARAGDAHGRGIALARLLSFDVVEYRGRGNRVVARVRHG